MTESLTLTWKLLRGYRRHTFFETGTYEGGGVTTALKSGYRRIISCDIDPCRARFVTGVFDRFPQVQIICGLSVDVLADMLPKLEEPITFWLDAHDDIKYSPTPLLRELSLVLSRPQVCRDVVLIDDMRILRKKSKWACKTSFDALVRHVRSLAPNAHIEFHDSREGKDDIMAITFD